MTSLDDFMNKNKNAKEPIGKRQEIEGSFACQKCNLYSPCAFMDQSGNLEWSCSDGHVSYGRI